MSETPKTLSETIPYVIDDVNVAVALAEIHRRLDDMQQSINSIGAQSTWVCESIQAIMAGFDQMQTEIGKAGPLGILKMLRGGKNDG